VLNPNILHQLSGASIEERIQLIEAILQTLKHDLSEPSQPTPHHHSLRGKLRHYDAPYEPIAAEDWEASA